MDPRSCGRRAMWPEVGFESSIVERSKAWVLSLASKFTAVNSVPHLLNAHLLDSSYVQSALL